MEDTVVIVIGGGAPAAGWAETVPVAAPVIAADSGVASVLAAGLTPVIVVGDLDSASPDALARAEALGARIERHPIEKDATDLELALETALTFDPRRVLIVGSDGGRLDHLFSAALVLASDRWSAVEIDGLFGPARLHIVRGTRTLPGDPGETLTLLALHGAATGVVTDGLAYPLRGETLAPGSSRGVSNTLVAPEATVTVGAGTLLALFPGTHP